MAPLAPNQFYFIGEQTYSFRPFGDRNTRVNWPSFSEWLAEELNCDPEDVECGDDFQGKELILVNGKIVGSFGGPLDRAPTPEEIQEDLSFDEVFPLKAAE